MDENSQIYIVIVNYHSADLISELLKDIDVPSYAGVILVDNSVDAEEWLALSAVARRSLSEIIRMDSNGGFGAGVNRGIAALEPHPDSYIWVLNPDTRVGPKCAADLANALDRYQADIVSPVIVTDPCEKIWYGGGDLDLKRGRTTHWSNVPTDVIECGFITGAAMMLRANSWSRLKGFREDLFMYWEDADLCIRANGLGMKMIVAPHVRIWHAVGATSAESGKSALYYFYMQRNRLIVLGSAFGINGIVGMDAVLEACRLMFRATREESFKIRKTWAGVRGIVDGVRALIAQRD